MHLNIASPTVARRLQELTPSQRSNLRNALDESRHPREPAGLQRESLRGLLIRIWIRSGWIDLAVLIGFATVSLSLATWAFMKQE
ncbi:MAG: hypothetical protein ACR2OU_03450 [Thermomicrobiales bacterium]